MGYGMDDDWGDLANDHFEESEAKARFDSIENKRNSMRSRYNDAKNADVGTTIRCPSCNRAIIKTTYNKVFCSNAKTAKKRKTNCKDAYWNFVPEARRERSSLYKNG